MPWSTPTLSDLRAQNRDYITGKLRKPLIPNDYPRVLADANAGNAHLNLQYLDWLATQLLPDTAEKQFLDKWANIKLLNADGSRGRKVATYATGNLTMTASVSGRVLPSGSLFTALSGAQTITLQTTTDTPIGNLPTSVAVRSLTAGAVGNLAVGTPLSLASAVSGINSSSGVIVAMSGGADEEDDDTLRARVLYAFSHPPMGGAADDYVEWATSVAGVTRAWCAANEMGPGTVTVRVMCDQLRATTNPLTNGFPLQTDLDAVAAFLDTVRPVTVKDFFVEAPIPQPVDFAIANLYPDSSSTRAAIVTNVTAMLAKKARPSYTLNGVLQQAETIPAAWVSGAILAAAGVNSFDLTMDDAVMANNGCMAILGSITYG